MSKPTKKTKKAARRVEVSINRNNHDECSFSMYDEKSNREFKESEIYSRRWSAIRGAKRYAAKNNYKIVRWLK